MKEGVWARLKTATSTLQTGIRKGLSSGDGPTKENNLWGELQARLDMAAFRPQPIQGVVESRLESQHEGPYYVIKNPRDIRYLRLSEKDHYVWTLMDGTKSIRDLVVAYFFRFSAFANERVVALTERLRLNGFFAERPYQLYNRIESDLRRNSLGFKAQKMRDFFFQKTIAIDGIDAVLTKLYEKGFWLFFLRPFKWAYVMISLLGLYLFMDTLRSGTYSLIKVQDSYTLGLIAMIVMNVIVVSVHEMAHAFTTKSYGREVPRGGFILYFGMPCFFVETSDIWLERKERRIAVSWAGPYSAMILAGLCCIIIAIFPDFWMSGLLFKTALWCYVSIFLNLNPLLEFDGYYILVDSLELPMLRKRSLTFLKQRLWGKLAGQELFTYEEKVFTIYGILAAIWAGVVVLLAVFMVKWRFFQILQDLSTSHSIMVRMLSVMLLLFLIPLAVSFLALLYLGLRQITVYICGLSCWSRIPNVVWALVGLGVILSFWPYLSLVIPMTGYAMYAIPVVFLATIPLAVVNLQQVKGAKSEGELGFLLGFIVMLFMTALFSLIAIPSLKDLTAMVASIMLLLWAWRILIGYDMNLLSRPEKIALTLAVPVALAGGLQVYWWTLQPDRSSVEIFKVCLTVGSQVFAFMVLLPRLLWYKGTDLRWPVSLFGGAFLLFSLPHPSLYLLGAMLLAVGMVTWYLIHDRMGFERSSLPPRATFSDSEKIHAVFAFFCHVLLRKFSETYGERMANVLQKEFNTVAPLKWRVRMVAKAIVEEEYPASIIELGERYQAVLTHLVSLLLRLAGKRFVEKVSRDIYDQLYWEEREIANQHLFQNLQWAKRFYRSAIEWKPDEISLVGQIPIFQSLTTEELKSLISAFRKERSRVGHAIIAQGDRGDKFYIITSGTAEVLNKNQAGETNLVATLRRGDYFGEIALLQDVPITATVRAAADMELLSLNRHDFDTMVKTHFAIFEKVEASIDILVLLRKMPLLAEFSLASLTLIASKMRVETYEPNACVIQAGDIGTTFYVIKSGEVHVLVTDGTGNRTRVATLGAGEYFGEVALIMNVPRTTSVVTTTQTALLVLDKVDFDRFLREHLYTSQSLEQIASRRLYDLRRQASGMMLT